MEGKLFLGHYLIWMMLLLGQLHRCKSCFENERKALLELKKYLISKSSESSYREETKNSNLDFVLPTWTNDAKDDCCGWKGVACNHTSGRIVGISVGRMYFKRPSLLNLSLLHPFEEIRSLDLSPGGDIYPFSFKGFFDEVEGYKSLRKLKYLEILDLSANAFIDDIFPFLETVTSLTTLDLCDNFVGTSRKELDNSTFGSRLSNSSIQVLTHLKNLKALDLSGNYLNSSMILQDLKNLTNLEVLGLVDNKGDGPIPIEVCEMKNLQELDLSGNIFVGEIPLCLGSLNMLRVLDLSSNRLSGNLPSSFSSLEFLEYLSLVDNNFMDLFSLNPLTNLTKLKVLKLSSTSDMVQVETESNWQPKFELRVVVLRSCSLEKIPSFLVYQKNLRLVDLSSNRLSGNVPTWLLANNSELEVLQLQNNAYTIFEMPSIVHKLKVLDVSANHIGGMLPNNIGNALPNMVDMNGSYNGFQGEFPSSMGEMKNISFLDLSYNNFSGKLPTSFFTGCVLLNYLMLSSNKFTGHVFPRATSFTSLRIVRMDNNLFTGKIGVGLLNSDTTLSILDMSNNLLTGFIPSWLSKLSRLYMLSLSNNLIEGKIPPSLVDLNSLSILDLSGNVLSGALPSHMAVRNLLLHDNSFTGPIPSLLEGVKILSLGNNKLSGSIPQFVNSPDIHILLLRANNLTRDIPRQLCDLSNIGVLDLSENKLSGLIPSCLSNLSFGVRGDPGGSFFGVNLSLKRFRLEFYKFTFVVEELALEKFTSLEIEINIAVKQRYESYNSGGVSFRQGILDYMYGMDLSNNELSGVIPEELGDLPIVRSLNLSHNFLSGSIPSNFSNLKAIESLDLSYNMLHGSIPYQLTSLTSLAVFDVSHNNLSGLIPQGRQFNTFNEKNYLNNPLLCGPPTHVNCEANKSSEEANNGRGEEENEAVIDRLVFYYSTASFYVAALMGVVVLMCFDCPWRRAWLRIVDAFIASAKNMLS